MWFVFNNKELSDEELANLFEEVETINNDQFITFFEILTACYFYQAAKYPSNITEDFESYLKNKNLMIAKINDVMHTKSTYHVHLPEVLAKVSPFFSGERLYDTIKKAIVSWQMLNTIV